MNIIKSITESTKIDGLKSITLDTFKDYRGEIWTVYSDEYTDLKFVADKITISRFGVLRGFHGDPYTAKLITCLSGQFQLAIVDTRKDSKTYGNVETYLVSDNEPMVVVVPAGCVNAWDDPDIDVDWAIKSPILSERDKNGVPLLGISL